MAEWLVEEGIGEDRAICLRGGEIAAARLQWPGEPVAGQVALAKLIQRNAGSARGLGQLEEGSEILLDRLPSSLSEGQTFAVEIVRAPIAERGRLKRAQGRVVDRQPQPPPTLFQCLTSEGHSVQRVRRFPPSAGWDELVGEAFDREVAFAGGTLLLAPTPAMVLVDVDGALAARELSLAAVRPIASVLARMDIGGMVGIDFPTLGAKADRKAVDDALSAALEGRAHERTAMNGFGFVQLVSRLTRPSLLHRAAHSRAGLAARQLLRRAEGIEDAGALLLTCHPAVAAQILSEWRDALARRTGREIRLRTDASLALESGFAQAVPR